MTAIQSSSRSFLTQSLGFVSPHPVWMLLFCFFGELISLNLCYPFSGHWVIGSSSPSSFPSLSYCHPAFLSYNPSLHPSFKVESASDVSVMFYTVTISKSMPLLSSDQTSFLSFRFTFIFQSIHLDTLLHLKLHLSNTKHIQCLCKLTLLLGPRTPLWMTPKST
jgi:hypothetical protein